MAFQGAVHEVPDQEGEERVRPGKKIFDAETRENGDAEKIKSRVQKKTVISDRVKPVTNYQSPVTDFKLKLRTSNWFVV